MDESDFSRDLENGLLLAYVEGAVDAETAARVEARLAGDEALAAEARELAEIHRALVAASDAPLSSEELGEYALGLLPRDRALALERRLARDPAARQRLDSLRAYLAGPAMARQADSPGPLERAGRHVRVLVAELARGLNTFGAPGVFAPAPAGVRGGAPRALSLRAGDAELILEFETPASDRTKRAMLGLLAGIDEPEKLAALLYRGGELTANSPIDELGNFIFPTLEPATYHLILRGDTLEISAPDIEIP